MGLTYNRLPMQGRWNKMRRLLKKEGAEALVVVNSEGSGQPATRWLCGFTGSSSVVVIVRDGTAKTPPPLIPPQLRGEGKSRKRGTKANLITDGRYTVQGRKEALGCNVQILKEHMSYSEALRNVISEQKIQTVLIDGSATSYSTVEQLKKELPQLSIISRSHLLQELRIVKDKQELKLLARAADVACRAFSRLITEMKTPPLLSPPLKRGRGIVGMSEKEIADRLETLMVEEGGDGEAFPTIVASGKNGALPHARPTSKKIRAGELVIIDFGVRYHGYVSDTTRTVAVGNISFTLRRMYDAVKGAQELVCKNAKAGMTGGDIDALARNSLKKKGFGKYFSHAVGHGIGMEVHELPAVSPLRKGVPESARGRVVQSPKAAPFDKGDTLPVGAVITCEPGVYIPKVGGVRIEDTLVLTKKGVVNLQREVTKKLIVLKA